MAGDMVGAGEAKNRATWQKTVAKDFKKLKANWSDCMDRAHWKNITSDGGKEIQRQKRLAQGLGTIRELAVGRRARARSAVGRKLLAERP